MEGGAFLNMVFFTTMFTTADVNIHTLIAKYGKFVTGATLLQLGERGIGNLILSYLEILFM
jgi:hypothetical protein